MVILLVPNKLIVRELNAAVHSGIITDDDYPDSPTGEYSDRFTECIELGSGIAPPNEHNLFERIVVLSHLGPCSAMVSNLVAYSNGETLNRNIPPHYWHGLSVISRPTLVTVGVKGVRTLAILLLIAAVIAIAQAVSSLHGKKAALVLLGPFIMTSDILTLQQSFHHPMMIAIGFMGVAYLVRCARHNYGYADLLIPAFLTGSFYSFFDLLNFVPGLWIMSVAVVGGCTPCGHNPVACLRRMSAVGVAWLTGYISMWMGKWVWVDIATSWSGIRDFIIWKIRFRMNGAGDTDYAYGFAEGLKRNIVDWLDQPFSILMLAYTIAMILLCLARRRHLTLTDWAVSTSPVLMFIPLILISNNWHAMHAQFEFRSIPLVLGSTLFMLHVTSSTTPKLAAHCQELPHQTTKDCPLSDSVERA